jgi:nicotinamide-nucleotide amidase
MPRDLAALADSVLALAKEAGVTLVVAESCTAGQLSQLLSDAEGAAAHFEGGFVTYTKAQKSTALGVSRHVLRDKGAVCGEVARAMAEGALLHSHAAIAAAITGVAGPEPDDDGNPVGRVCIAVARRGLRTREVERNYGPIDRDAVRQGAVREALELLRETLAQEKEAA